MRLETLSVAGDEVGLLVNGHQDVRCRLIFGFVFKDRFGQHVKERFRFLRRVRIAELSNAVPRKLGRRHGVFIAGNDFQSAPPKAARGDQRLPATRESDDSSAGTACVFCMFTHVEHLPLPVYNYVYVVLNNNPSDAAITT